MMISFVICNKCHTPVADSWDKCPLCGYDVRRFSFAPETKHLIISTLLFLGVCGLAILFAAINDRQMAKPDTYSSYRPQKSALSSNYKPSSYYNNSNSSLSETDLFNSLQRRDSSSYKTHSVSRFDNEAVPAVPDTLDLTRCTDLSYVRKSKSVRAYQQYLKQCNDSEYVVVSGELEDVVAANCRRYRKLPSAEQAALKEILEEFEQPMPTSMTFFQGHNEDNERSGPLKIKTTTGSDGYVIKLIKENGVTGVECFFPAGDDVNINVAYGTYTLKYASGSKWYGGKIRFGLSAAYSKVNTVLDFKRRNSWDGWYNVGHSLTLYKILNGNMTTTDIDGEDF